MRLAAFSFLPLLAPAMLTLAVPLSHTDTVLSRALGANPEHGIAAREVASIADSDIAMLKRRDSEAGALDRRIVSAGTSPSRGSGGYPDDQATPSGGQGGSR